MRKLFLFLFIALFMSQAASAITFDTVWVNNIRNNGQAYHSNCQFACFSSDTTKIFAAMDSTIYILDIQTGDIIDSMEKAPNTILINATSISFDKKRIASILNNNKAVVWDDSTKRIIKIFEGDTLTDLFGYYKIALSPDGRYSVIAASYKDNIHLPTITRLLVYDLNADTIVKWIGYTDQIQYIAFSPDGNSFVLSTYNTHSQQGVGQFIKYFVNGWHQDSLLEENSSFYSYLAYSNDSKYIAGAKQDSARHCYVWDNTADTIYKTYSREKLGKSYSIINFSPDNHYLLFGGGIIIGPDSLRTQIWDFINDISIYNSNIWSGAGIQFSNNNNFLLLVDNRIIFLLTPNWTKTSVEAINVNNEDDLQILPNPASEAMTISYNLAHSGNARLSLYNQLGQEVAILKNEWVEAGRQDFRFTIDDFRLNVGMYFVRLQAGSEVRNQKLLITNY